MTSRPSRSSPFNGVSTKCAPAAAAPLADAWPAPRSKVLVCRASHCPQRAAAPISWATTHRITRAQLGPAVAAGRRQCGQGCKAAGWAGGRRLTNGKALTRGGP
eukprot:5186219-Prymnesium_polylepis.1